MIANIVADVLEITSPHINLITAFPPCIDRYSIKPVDCSNIIYHTQI
jgi:hypothetical protein